MLPDSAESGAAADPPCDGRSRGIRRLLPPEPAAELCVRRRGALRRPSPADGVRGRCARRVAANLPPAGVSGRQAASREDQQPESPPVQPSQRPGTNAPAGSHGANPGYVLGQLARALATSETHESPEVRARADRKVEV